MDRLLELFADILEYPSATLPRSAAECFQAAAAAGFPSDDLAEFCRTVQGMPLGRLEEVYTAAFDMNTSATPYVGYHLFGDGYQRSAFLLELQKRYRERGHAPGAELADHLCVMLRFVALCPDQAERRELVHEALLPALKSMVGRSSTKGPNGEQGAGGGPGAAGPYGAVLSALQAVLERG